MGNAFTVEKDGDIAVVVFDLPGESVNKFSASVKDEFRSIMMALKDDASVKGIVLISGVFVVIVSIPLGLEAKRKQ